MSGPRLHVEVRPAGLYVPALDLHLDPDRDVDNAFVSHAHGDHTAGHGSRVFLGSKETLSLIETRRSARPIGARVIEWDQSMEVPCEGGTARFSIAPAGHVLGAAQLVIDHPRGRLVYTGDYRSGGGATHAEGKPIACDDLVVETTFGLPIFKFPPRAQTVASIVAWCRACLDHGETPVLLAYALGKSQALVHEMLAANLPVVAHGAVYRMCAAYESFGIPLGVADGRLRPYAEEKSKRIDAVLIAPPQTQGQPMIRKRKETRIAYCSGWSLIDAAVEQRRADAGFPYSDHADHDDLVATVRASGASHVYTTHGEALVFAEVLAHHGIDATPLESRSLDEGEEAAK